MAADIKAYLRGVMSACRRGLPAEYVTARSLAVQQRLLGSASYATASTLVLYAAKDNEICTDLLLTEAVAAGRRVLFPKLERATRGLILIPVTSSACASRSGPKPYQLPLCARRSSVSPGWPSRPLGSASVAAAATTTVYWPERAHEVLVWPTPSRCSTSSLSRRVIGDST